MRYFSIIVLAIYIVFSVYFTEKQVNYIYAQASKAVKLGLVDGNGSVTFECPDGRRIWVKEDIGKEEGVFVKMEARCPKIIREGT